MAAYPHWPILARYPQVLTIINQVDHADIKTAESAKPLRPFVAAMFSYSPAWVRMLFAARIALAWLLRLENPPASRPALTAEDVPMSIGDCLKFFTVVMARTDRYWIADAADGHLRAILGRLGVIAPGPLAPSCHDPGQLPGPARANLF